MAAAQGMRDTFCSRSYSEDKAYGKVHVAAVLGHTLTAQRWNADSFALNRKELTGEAISAAYSLRQKVLINVFNILSIFEPQNQIRAKHKHVKMKLKEGCMRSLLYYTSMSINVTVMYFQD